MKIYKSVGLISDQLEDEKEDVDYQKIAYYGTLKRKSHERYIKKQILNLGTNIRWLDSGHP